MTELFDTHAHFEGSAEDIRRVTERAAAAGVTRIMAVGGNPQLNAATEGFAYRAIGWDRDMAGKDTDPLDYTGVAAVGEIGLDYHYSPETAKAQMELFALQLETARAFGLPVVIHTRDADDDTLGILREIPSRGVIHCFTGSPKFCRALLDLGFMISISGIVTFNAADNVRESALVVPDDRILIETDSPFLAPVPLRGQTNEPAFLTRTAAFLADVRRTAVDALAALTYANAVSLLG
jgi:TatD DNase family protein